MSFISLIFYNAFVGLITAETVIILIQMVVLVGPSGAEKTTIVNLLLKIYDPTKREIKINDQSYNDLTHNFIRKNISLKFQDNEPFSSTIKENISYGSEVDDAKVEDTLKKANTWDFVSKLSEGMNTEVGECGVRLSGGQRQRIQNARKVIVLNEKKIEADVTPQELSTQPGIYSDLLQYQIEGNKKSLKKFEIY